ncbi:putative ribonuclease H-like domain-containing protein [Tanacetum coccineum]
MWLVISRIYKVFWCRIYEGKEVCDAIEALLLFDIKVYTAVRTWKLQDVFVHKGFGVFVLFNKYKLILLLLNKEAKEGEANMLNVSIPFIHVSTEVKGSLPTDLEQIYEDDLEVMDLKWQLSLLSMRAKRASRNKKGQFRNQDNTRKHKNNEDTSSKAMLAIDGIGFDWSDMAEEQVQINMALMVFSDSEVYNDKTCSKSCLKNYETLKKQCDDLIVKLNQTEFIAATYKRGLATVEEQLITYRQNEVLFSEEVVVLKREVACKYDSKENSDDSLIKEQVSKDTSSFVESLLNIDKENVFLDKKIESVKSKNHEKPVKKSVRGGACGGRISGKGTLKTDSLDFEDIYFVNELKLNLFCVSQMCDKKNYVLFTDTERLVLSPNFRLPDESQILLKNPRKDNMYCFDMKNIVPKESLTCLDAKATLDESMLWHKRLGHINFKNVNKLVKDNLVRGKQHRASCKSKVLNLFAKPLFMLHMDLFGPTFDETNEILKNFIKEIENLVDKKVKIIRCDNGTEFKNKVMDDFCREKGIRREYSVARTPQQNGVADTCGSNARRTSAIQTPTSLDTCGFVVPDIH